MVKIQGNPLDIPPIPPQLNGMDMGMHGGDITPAELDYYQRLYESMYGPPPGMSASGVMGGGFGPGGLPSVSQLMHMAMTTPLFPFGKQIKKRRPCIRRKPRRPNAQEGSLYYNKKNRLYEVRICDKGKQVYLGQFESEPEAEKTLKEARAAKLSNSLQLYKINLKKRKSLLRSGKSQKRNARGHFIRQRSAKPPTYLADLPLRTSRGNPREADIDELLVRKELQEPGSKKVKMLQQVKPASGRILFHDIPPGNISPNAQVLDSQGRGFSIIDLDLASPISKSLMRPAHIKTED